MSSIRIGLEVNGANLGVKGKPLVIHVARNFDRQPLRDHDFPAWLYIKKQVVCYDIVSASFLRINEEYIRPPKLVDY